MNIAIDARFYGLEHAGLGRYTKNLVEQLARIDTKNRYTLFVQPEYKGLLIADNFVTKVVEASPYSIWEQIKLTNALHKGHYDLVHFPHFIVPIFNLSTPFVVTIHDLIKHKHRGIEASTLSPLMYGLKQYAYRFDMWWAVHKSKHILVPTEFVKQDVKDWFHIDPPKISVTFEGVDGALTAFDSTENQRNEIMVRYGISGPYMLYVGSAYPYKKVDVLVDALTYMPENVSLVLIGSRSVFYKRIEDLVSSRGFTHRVKMLGYVPDSELSVLYSQASCFVSASQEEGFGIPPLEAMSMSCPVVLSDIPVHKEVCGDAAIYVSECGAQGFADTVANLLTNESLRAHLIEKGLSQVKKYSWEEMAKQTLKMYESTDEAL